MKIIRLQVLNKVAGVYGLISAFTGGTLGQLSFYVYSTVTLAVAVWGLRAISAVSTALSIYKICSLTFALVDSGIVLQGPQTRTFLRDRSYYPNDIYTRLRSSLLVRGSA